MANIVADAFGPKRLTMILLLFFAGVAVSLAVIGLYAVVNYGVARRTRELGIRMAIGAGPREIVRLVLSDGARVAVIGLAAGLAIAFVGTRAMSAVLSGVSATNPIVFIAVTVLLAASMLGAAVIPACRATRLDPLKALRAD